jgi:hypothetical protein
MMKRSIAVGACIGAITIAACGSPSSEPIRPAIDTTVSTPTPPPSGLAAYHLTGKLTDADGTPLTSGFVCVTYSKSTNPGSFYRQASTAGDGAGLYSLDINAIPGAMNGPPAMHDAWAFAYASRPGYESDYRYISSSEQNFRLYRIKRIAAGDSTAVTVAPDDAICDNNVQEFHPWPDEWVCRTIHVSVPANGKMLVWAVPTQLGGAVPGLVLEGAFDPPYFHADMGALKVPAVAGDVITVNIEIPWGSATSQSFVLHTSLIQK